MKTWRWKSRSRPASTFWSAVRATIKTWGTAVPDCRGRPEEEDPDIATRARPQLTTCKASHPAVSRWRRRWPNSPLAVFGVLSHPEVATRRAARYPARCPLRPPYVHRGRELRDQHARRRTANGGLRPTESWATTMQPTCIEPPRRLTRAGRNQFSLRANRTPNHAQCHPTIRGVAGQRPNAVLHVPRSCASTRR